MASYQMGFDPPTRPSDPPRTRRMGTYTHQVQSRGEHRDADIAHMSGQMESRRGQAPASRPQYTGLPRPNMRDPSPSTRSVPDTKPRGVAASSFGFGKSSGKTVAPAPAPVLKGKSSRNVLRRKPSTVAWQQAGGAQPVERSTSSSPTKWSQSSAERRPSIESSLKSAEAYNEIYTRPSAKASTTRETPRIIPELDRYRTRPEQQAARNNAFVNDVPRLATQDLPPPTPLSSATSGHSAMSSNHNRYSGSGYSASPSTRFSESPGPGAYSRDTTPTSMSSQSPGIVTALKTTTPRLRQGSPAFTRPPVTRRRAGSTPNEDIEDPTVDSQGLPVLRESLTSSSSNSTVKGDGKAKEKKKKKRLSPCPPSPPPRKSSQKFKKSPNRSENEESPSKISQVPGKPVMTSPPDPSPIKPRSSPAQSNNKIIPPARPSRPSRDGTPDLQSQTGDSMTVIQSNLPSLALPQDRRRSATLHGISPQQLQPPRFQGSKLPSRNPSPTPVLTSPREGTPAPSGLGIVPNLRPLEVHPSTRATATRTPSPSVANTKSRFGLFGRRNKTAPEVPMLESKDKVLRKGPAAGTGHEGYGRYAMRGRSSSAGGVGRGRERSFSGASSSQESVASTRSHDPFLLERMSPVIIAGGGEIVENRNASSELTRTESNTSLPLGRPSLDSKVLSKTSLSKEASRATLWPSALPRDNVKRASTLAIRKGRRPSDSSDDGMAQSSSLAIRRSMQRLNNSGDALQLPKPISIPAMGMSPSLKSLESSILSDDSKNDQERGRKGQLTKPKKLEKRPKSPRKWNFFHRSQPKTEPPVEVALPVTVGRPAVKPVPHYAMLDSSDENQEPGEMDLEDILRDADVMELSDGGLDALQFGDYKENLRRIETVNTMMKTPIPEPIPERPPIIFSSPEPTPATPELPKVEIYSNKEVPVSQPMDLHLTEEAPPPRPSRLLQVGRIPKVVSARPVATSPKSFSRPFARLSTVHPVFEPAILDEESIGLGPSPPKSTTPEPQLPEIYLKSLGLRQESGDSESTGVNHKDFLEFSPRKNSEATTSSSGGMSFAGTTAVIPEADSALEEDEVWDEYDDLIENEPVKVPVSATSSQGVPFQYESYESRKLRLSKLQGKETTTLAPKINEPSSPTRRSALTSSSHYSTDMTARMKDAFAIVPTPTTPMSFADFFSGYGDRNNSVQGDSARKPRRSSQSSSRKSTSSTHTRSGSGLRTITEQDSNSPISQVNLRVGSMTVSKWLTFGHVLFSPAREAINHLQGSKRHSILVIDGLGNDDWSFYAAETYPSATFYNLSPTRPLSATQRLSSSHSFPLTPTNHRQIQHLSPTNKFPFPSSTFHVVVFRFPSAMSEAAYRNTIAESKRVLKPGGYLELAILDLDMLSMGNRARRAVRALKVQMQAADPNISLGSASDTVLRIVGKRGFTDLKSCKVGVPVASTVSASASSSPPKIHSQLPGEEMSLADMMKDSSRASDEGITKMVAKVGRWWYTRCYEMGVLPNGDVSQSIFNDAALLNESEKWSASFKLVVAYAQKPAQGRRRTSSI